MSRVKLTEHKAKQLLYRELGISYSGVAVFDGKKISYTTPLSSLQGEKKYVVKVDQGVKGRMKKGLVELGITKDELENSVKKLARTGYSQLIIEEMVPHKPDQERYISLERVRTGILARYSKHGGIDIEAKINEVKSELLNKDYSKISKELGVGTKFIESLVKFFEENYVSFLEINPLVVESIGSNLAIKQFSNSVHILDLAVEVDSTASYFTKGWQLSDIVADQKKSLVEIAISKLNDNSQAALSFTLLNPNGAIWVLLSGGGASITLADEFYNLGFGKELGNYGEYSGNPSKEETYLYTKEFLKAMFKSNSKSKVILIGGGVANFTDVRITFSGILKAFEEAKTMMRKNNVKVFVRRGGPKQKEGLALIDVWLKRNDMYGYVTGPEMPLYEIVAKVVESL